MKIRYEGRLATPIRRDSAGGTTYSVVRTSLEDIQSVMDYLMNIEATLLPGQKAQVIAMIVDNEPSNPFT